MLKTLSLLALSFALSTVAIARSIQDVPNPTDRGGYVSNPDGIISEAQAQALSDRIAQLKSSTGNEVGIALVETIGDQTPKTFATDLFNLWGIGKKGQDNGILILLVMDQRRIEIEVGYGLEGTLTDIETSWIIENHMIPLMRSRDADGALHSALSQLQTVFTAPGALMIPDSEGNYTHNLAARLAYGVETLNPQTVIPVSVFALLGFIGLSIFLNVLRSRTGFQRKGFLIALIAFIGLAILACVAVAFFIAEARTQGIILFALLNSINLVYLLRKRPDAVSHFIHGKSNELPQSLGSSAFFHWTSLALVAWRLGLKAKKKVVKPAGFEMVSEDAEGPYLSKAQEYEERLGSVEYDVYLNPETNDVQLKKNVLPLAKYDTCKECGTKSETEDSRRVLVNATYDSSGIGEKTMLCYFCKAERREQYTIPMKVKTSSGGSSGGSFGGGGGGGSFGGGRSGGGGAGGSW